MGLRDATGAGARRRRRPRRGEHARPAPARHRLHPRGPPARRHGAVVPAVGERAARPPGRCRRSCRGGLLDRGADPRAHQARIVDEFDVRTPGIEVPAFTLSGGNQQKLIVGREMTSEPRVLVASHPTRGVDVGAQAVIWDILRDARAQGLATLLISADLEELIGLSDRLLVMLRGAVVAELDPASVTPAELGSYMTGAAPPAERRREPAARSAGSSPRCWPRVVAIVVSSIALLIAGESPVTAFSEMWKTIDSTAVGRADHQPRRAVLRRRRRRRHRVQDEPVQHRRRRPVPARRPARRRRRRRGLAAGAAARRVRVPRRHRRRRAPTRRSPGSSRCGAASTR